MCITSWITCRAGCRRRAVRSPPGPHSFPFVRDQATVVDWLERHADRLGNPGRR
jgi:hypothetical protein